MLLDDVNSKKLVEHLGSRHRKYRIKQMLLEGVNAMNRLDRSRLSPAAVSGHANVT
jgi:hypothetical protein